MLLLNTQFTPMKKLLFFFSLIIAAGCSHAQSFTPPTTIPPYHILTTDSVYATPANLKKHKPVMIIYFAPDCSHCQHLMYEMKNNMEPFKNIQIVMVTFALPLKASQIFYRDFDLKRYPNITLGTEGRTYVVQRFYQVTTTPYIAFYDKNEKLTKAFDKAPKIEDLVAEAKKL
jgi:thiol-disulfide isomerase/thioredoxin